MSSDARQASDRRKGFHLPVWLRNPAGVALIIGVLFGILGTLPILTHIGRPFGGFAAYGFQSYDTAELAYDTPIWWPVITNGTLTSGDLIATVDGRPFTPNAWDAFADAYAAGRLATLDVIRRTTGEELTAAVAPLPVTIGHVVDLEFTETVVGLVFWLLALLVLRARPGHITNQVFAIIAVCVAIHRLTIITGVITDTGWWVNLPKAGHMLAAGLIGPLLVHLATVFPTVGKRRPRALLVALTVVGGLAGLTLALGRLPLPLGIPELLDDSVGRVAYMTMLYLLLGGILALFGRLIWSWRRESHTRRQQRTTRIILLGLLGSLPAIIVILVPIVPSAEPARTAFWRGLDVRWLMLSIPIAFAYVIIRYQTFKGVSRLFLIIIILSLSGVLAALGAWLWQLSQPAGAVVLRPPFVTLFTFICLASAIWSVQGGWRGWFGRYLHWEPRTYDAARAFGRRVMGASSLRELPPAMAAALVDELALERAAVWLWQADSGGFQLAAEAGATAPPLPSQLDGPAGIPRGRAIRTQPADRAPIWLRPLAAAGGIEVAVPLVAGGAPIGLLGLGRRWDEEIFDDRDLAVADLVGQQATLFLQASLQVEELHRVPDRVAAAQERERLRVAGELHDTIQQFLGRLPFFLAAGRDRLRDDPQAAADILDRCLTDVEEAAAVLRRIRVSLAPNQLETNLLHSLHGLVAHVQQRSGLAVTLVAPPDLDEALNPETRHALYRVIQQALDNTVAHAGATAAGVTLAREDGRVMFSVRDDGCGSSADERRAAQAAGSFGLKSMAARLELCGGVLAFDSAPGAGTTVGGWVPAAGGHQLPVL